MSATRGNTPVLTEQRPIFPSEPPKRLKDFKVRGWHKLVQYYKNETAICKQLTRDTTLTVSEYDKASEDFKVLIDTPYKAGEPIYIMPEFDSNKKLNAELAALVAAIKKGNPYQSFITKSLGHTWPLLLRLYYGLSSGFSISIDQFHTMLKFCYWNELKYVKVRSEPMFDLFFPTQIGSNLLALLHYKNQLTENMKLMGSLLDSKIPKGELDVTVIELDINYFRAVRLAQDPHSNESKKYNDLEKKYYPGEKSKYAYADTGDFMITEGLEMFSAIMHISASYHKMIEVDGKAIIIIPSATVIKKYFATVNPDRALKLVYKLGPYGPADMEAYSDKNARLLNLYAPGIRNPLVGHGKVVPPAMGLEHDDYHIIFEALLTKSLYSQMTRGKNIFRKMLGDKIISSEITRFLDRERTPEVLDGVRFFELIKYVFTTDPNKENEETRLSSIIVLTDMILSPTEWPSYANLKRQLIDLCLHSKANDNSVQTVESTARRYAAAVNNDVTLTAILMLCHFHLKDESLSKILVERYKNNPEEPFAAWRKMPHGHMFPVLILKGMDNDFEKLAKLSPQTRAILWMQAKVAVAEPEVKAEVEVEVQVQAPVPAMIVIKFSEFTAAKHQLIEDNKGMLIQYLGGIAEVKIESELLKKPLRDALGIDRVKMLGKERCDHLEAQGIVVEKTGDVDKFQLTFMKSQRELVEMVAKNWESIKPAFNQKMSP